MSLGNNDVLEIKAKLLAGCYINIDKELVNYSTSKELSLSHTIRVDNLYSFPWIFIKLSETSRVRMIVSSDRASFKLLPSQRVADKYSILDMQTNKIVVEDIEIEDVVYHCPKQLFYDLYEFCFIGCKFCPLSESPRWSRDTVSKILSDINQIDLQNIDGIGLTSGIPAHKSGDRVTQEMASIVRTIRLAVGGTLPIGVSPLQPSKNALLELKDAGVNEVRINLETFNSELARLVIPNKPPEITLRSIETAVSIFGRGMVSSNIVIGIGESDDDVVEGIDELSRLGAIPTIYPYDIIEKKPKKEMDEIIQNTFRRPGYTRLVCLSMEHKKILSKYDLDPNLLMTMCPRCAASHIMPGKDL